jgi:uncharacterized repeat protein (TIGR03847 family)
LQVNHGDRVLTVKVEKAQVAELGEHLAQAVADRPPLEAADASTARMVAEAEPDWIVGSIRLGYDAAAERLALVLEEFRRNEEEGEGASAMIVVSADQAAALANEIGELVAAGRPPCPDCGYPLDSSGHVCPKSNGHRPPKL